MFDNSSLCNIFENLFIVLETMYACKFEARQPASLVAPVNAN